jgi:putative transposase
VTDTNVFQLSQPGTFTDPLTEVLRTGARALLAQALEAEVSSLLSCHADKLTDDGRRRLVRHGHLPEREIMTGIGPVAVHCPRVRDRGGDGSERIRFSSAILPPYARRSKSLEVLIPILYLKGVSTGDFEEALVALLGKEAGGLSASTIGRVKDAWSDEHAHWSTRDLSIKHCVYLWVDGVHVQARLEDAAQCLLVIIGATPEGKKELVGLIDGVRESAQSWRELLLDLKRRGLSMAPELAVADGALACRSPRPELAARSRRRAPVDDAGGELAGDDGVVRRPDELDYRRLRRKPLPRLGRRSITRSRAAAHVRQRRNHLGSGIPRRCRERWMHR